MKEIEGLDELRRWVLNANDALRAGVAQIYRRESVSRVTSLIASVAGAIRDEYPFYADELPRISSILFTPVVSGCPGLNNAAFGELFVIVKHLRQEPQDSTCWVSIHPRVTEVAKGLFLDGHYLSAADRSIVEVEDRLREVFQRLKPGSVPPAKVGDLIGGLLSDSGAYHFCDTSTRSGKDYRKGIKMLFEGAFSAFRNPQAHENMALSKDAAFDRIVLASQLMKVLDGADK